MNATVRPIINILRKPMMYRIMMDIEDDISKVSFIFNSLTFKIGDKKATSSLLLSIKSLSVAAE